MLDKAQALSDELIRLRRDIHRFPELAFKEVRKRAPDDPELLADMVLAAANEALRAATQAVETKLRGQMPDLGALGLPGM